MWCKHCQQDTPSISSASRHGMCCGRCGVPLSGPIESAAQPADEPCHPAEVGLDLDSPPPGMARSFEDWQLDHNVRSMRARMEPWQSRRPARRPQGAGSGRPQWRVDAAHRRVPAPHKPKRRNGAAGPGGRSPTFTNSALMMGLMACAGGAAMLAWSVAEARGDIWNVGVSAIVAGGVVFLFGLVLQLERIWHNSRFAVNKLRQIDSHLQDLERSTASLAVTHGSASGDFYSHLADQAHPHLLLSDLKGQLDLLAMDFARR
jgi:hypothetical protein